MPVDEQKINLARQYGYSDDQIQQYIASRQPKRSFTGFLGNVVKSAGRAIGDVAKAVTSPIQTGKNLLETAAGAVQLGTRKAGIPIGTGVYEPKAQAFADFYKDRYGGINNIGDTLYNDPVGAAIDVSTLLGGAGAVVKGAGTLGKASSVTRAGSALSKASKVTDPIRVAGSVAKKGGSKLFSGANKTRQAVADDLITRATKATKSQQSNIEKIARKPFTEVLKERDIIGSAQEVGEKARELRGTAQVAYNNLVRTGKQLPAELYPEYLLKKATEIDALDRSPGGRKLVQALLDEAEQQLTIAQQRGISDVQLTATKTGQFGRAPKGAITDPTSENLNKALGRAGAEALEDVAPGSRELGKELQILRELESIGDMQKNVGTTTQVFNAFKPGFAGLATGGFAGSVLPGVGNLAGASIGAIVSILANNPRVQAKVARALSSGQVPMQISPKLQEALRMSYETGRGTRIVNQMPQQEQQSPAQTQVQLLHQTQQPQQVSQLEQTQGGQSLGQAYTPIIPRKRMTNQLNLQNNPRFSFLR